MSNYPAGVSDSDPHFDLPSAGDSEGEGCPTCGHDGPLDLQGRCLYGYAPPDIDPGMWPQMRRGAN